MKTEDIHKLLEEHFRRPIEDIEKDFTFRLGNGLTILNVIQHFVSSNVPGCVPKYDEYPTKQQVATYGMALQIEVAEFLQTLDWKPWKTTEMDTERIVDEFADILAFLGIMIIYLTRLGISPQALAAAYWKKSLRNVSRIFGASGEKGYGVK